jgi:Flp pilus assembly protein TadB
MIEAMAFLLGVPAALIAGAVCDERRKAREKRRKRMERIALRDLREIKREMGIKEGGGSPCP